MNIIMQTSFSLALFLYFWLCNACPLQWNSRLIDFRFPRADINGRRPKMRLNTIGQTYNQSEKWNLWYISGSHLGRRQRSINRRYRALLCSVTLNLPETWWTWLGPGLLENLCEPEENQMRLPGQLYMSLTIRLVSRLMKYHLTPQMNAVTQP